jgi:hypothetical protein
MYVSLPTILLKNSAARYSQDFVWTLFQQTPAERRNFQLATIGITPRGLNPNVLESYAGGSVSTW